MFKIVIRLLLTLFSYLFDFYLFYVYYERKAIECLRILVSVETEMFESLDDVLNNYLAAMMEEQRLIARKRIDWLLVDERVRVDTTNLKFSERITKEKDNPSLSLGFDDPKTRNYYIELMREYLPIAERRYIDNVARAVTTHIFDVPLAGTRSEVRSDMSVKYPFSARNILKDDCFDQAMRLRNGLSEEKSMLEKRIDVLKELMRALRRLPSPKQFAGHNREEKTYRRHPTEDRIGDANGIVLPSYLRPSYLLPSPTEPEVEPARLGVVTPYVTDPEVIHQTPDDDDIDINDLEHSIYPDICKRGAV